MKIAMWSGPRNLSTAMMYSFASRPDCEAWDEPYYAAYLSRSGISHPLRDETLRYWPVDPDVVAKQCLKKIEKPIHYQKHMAHHMLDGFDLSWTVEVKNVFLIRHPARVIASYDAKRERPNALDIGFEAQADLYTKISEISGTAPPVVDASDIRNDPKGILGALCETLEIQWTNEMLSWPAGPKPADGPWAAHWYGSVHRSTGFSPDTSHPPELPEHLQPLLAESMPYYDALYEQRLGR